MVLNRVLHICKNMLLRNADQDLIFKRGFIRFVSPETIQFEGLRQHAAQFDGYTKVGRAYSHFGKHNDEKARELAELDLQCSEHSDECFLLFLKVILDLKQNVNQGKIERDSLDLYLKTRFRFALDVLNSDLLDTTLKRELTRMEVEDNSASDGTNIYGYKHIGELGWDRLVDYLLSDSDDDRLFALRQFEYLHSHNNRTYDSAYPAIKVAIKKSKQDDVIQKLLSLQKNIESANPSAVIPSIAQEIVAKIRGKSDPLEVLNSEITKWKFDSKDACILSLNTAHRLIELNDLSAARQILGEAAHFAEENTMFLACVAQELGDTAKAARLLLKETEKYVNDWHGIGRFYTTEAACRLLFQNDSIIWKKEFTSAIKRFEELRFDDVVKRLHEWLSYENGFESYLKRITEETKAEPFDKKEIRISQHRRSTLFFLEGANHDFRRNLKVGQRWFELSARGNDAPWIQGSRAFFSGIDSSMASFRENPQRRKQLILQAKQNFEKAAKYLDNQDPIAISIAFSALLDSLRSINGKVIGDLTFAIEMLQPRTPEVCEIKLRLSSLRWKLIEKASRSHSIDRKTCGDLWENVVRLVPLLDNVIDHDKRLSSRLFPFLEISSLEPFQTTVEGVLSVSDSNARGKILEDSVADIIARSSGLKLVDVRHSNNYEEIDIVILVTKGSPLLEQWGPIILLECKNWQKKVGTEPVGYLYSKMTTKKNAIKLGVMVSPSGFTKGVREQIARFPNCLILMFGPDELRSLFLGKKDIRDLLEEQIPLALLL
jgi:hypothetical protein